MKQNKPLDGFVQSYFSGPQGSLTVCLFTFENGVPLMRLGASVV